MELGRHSCVDSGIVQIRKIINLKYTFLGASIIVALDVGMRLSVVVPRHLVGGFQIRFEVL